MNYIATSGTVSAFKNSRGESVSAVLDSSGSIPVSSIAGSVVAPFAAASNFTSGTTAAITGTSNTSVIAAPGSGIRLYITSITVTNSHATTGTLVEIKDNTTVISRVYVAPAGGGAHLNFTVPLKLTANSPLQAANITTASNTYVTAVGYTAA